MAARCSDGGSTGAGRSDRAAGARIPGLYGPIDRNLGHHRRYSRESLAKLAHRNRPRIEKLHYVNAVGLLRMVDERAYFPARSAVRTQIRIFDRCIVPWLSRLEAISPPPFGQSLLP
jgi:hypothetical protein